MSGSEDDDAFLYGDDGDDGEEELNVPTAPSPTQQDEPAATSAPTPAVPLGEVPVVPLGSNDSTVPPPSNEVVGTSGDVDASVGTAEVDSAAQSGGQETTETNDNGGEEGVEEVEEEEEEADDGGEEYDDSSDEDIEITLSAPPKEASDAAQTTDKANEALNLTIQKDGGELKVRTAVTGSSSTNVAPSLSLRAEGEVDGVKTFDFDLDGADDKPWRNPGADLTDYFNYGFNEDTWRQYCDFQRANRMGMWKPMRDDARGGNGRGRNGDEVVVRVISNEREGMGAPPPPPGARYGPPPGQYQQHGPPHGHMGGGRGMGRGRGPPPNMNDRMLRNGPPPGFDERFQGGRRGPPLGYDGPPPDNDGLQPDRRRSRQPTPNAPGHHGNGHYGNNNPGEYDPEAPGDSTRDRGTRPQSHSRGRSRSRSPMYRDREGMPPRNDRDGPQRGDRYNRGREDKRADRHEDRQDRPDRTDRVDRNERPDRGERSDRRDRGDRGDRSDRGDRGTSNKDSRGTRESTLTRDSSHTRGDKGDRSDRRSERSSGRGERGSERRRDKGDRK